MFSDNYVDEVPKYMVFAVTGEGGVGKSTLLTQYEALARSPSINANVIICDDRHMSPASAMGYIAGELVKSGITHKGFDERYKKYRDMRQEIEGDTKAPRSWVNMLTMGVSDLTIKSLRKAPGVGVLFEYADEKARGKPSPNWSITALTGGATKMRSSYCGSRNLSLPRCSWSCWTTRAPGNRSC